MQTIEALANRNVASMPGMIEPIGPFSSPFLLVGVSRLGVNVCACVGYFRICLRLITAWSKVFIVNACCRAEIHVTHAQAQAQAHTQLRVVACTLTGSQQTEKCYLLSHAALNWN